MSCLAYGNILEGIPELKSSPIKANLRERCSTELTTVEDDWGSKTQRRPVQRRLALI